MLPLRTQQPAKMVMVSIIILIITVYVTEFATNVAAAAAATGSTTERVNCRRVVFHPYCRGISAKRALLQEHPHKNDHHHHQLGQGQHRTPLPSSTQQRYSWLTEELRRRQELQQPDVMLFSDLKLRIMEQFNRRRQVSNHQHQPNHYHHHNKIEFRPRISVMADTPVPTSSSTPGPLESIILDFIKQQQHWHT